MKADMYSDPELIQMIRRGGLDLEKALRYLELEEKRSLRIKKLILGMGGSVEDYKEIMNDVLCALYTGVIRKNFNEEYPLNGYMIGTAKNLWYKRFRKMKYKTEEIDIPTQVEEPSFEVRVIEKERCEILLSIMDQLGETCKSILVKAKLEGYSYDELVEMTHYKNKAVLRKTVCECMKRLAQLIEDNPHLRKQLEQ